MIEPDAPTPLETLTYGAILRVSNSDLGWFHMKDDSMSYHVLREQIKGREKYSCTL